MEMVVGRKGNDAKIDRGTFDEKDKCRRPAPATGFLSHKISTMGSGGCYFIVLGHWLFFDKSS
jgi:hypothetical protein